MDRSEPVNVDRTSPKAQRRDRGAAEIVLHHDFVSESLFDTAAIEAPVIEPAPTANSFSNTWSRGERVAGVSFGPAMRVRILGGPFADESGCVRELFAIDPEPCYRVEIDGARVRVLIAQSALDSM